MTPGPASWLDPRQWESTPVGSHPDPGGTGGCPTKVGVYHFLEAFFSSVTDCPTPVGMNPGAAAARRARPRRPRGRRDGPSTAETPSRTPMETLRKRGWTDEGRHLGSDSHGDPASTCSRPYLRVQLPHPQASQRWKLLEEPEEDSRKIPQDKPQDQKYHQSRGKPPDRARPLPDGRQKAATNRVRPAERPDPRAQGVSAAPSARKSPASQGTGPMQELPEPRQTGPDPLPHLRRETPRVQQAQQCHAERYGGTISNNGPISHASAGVRMNTQKCKCPTAYQKQHLLEPRGWTLPIPNSGGRAIYKSLVHRNWEYLNTGPG